MTAKFIQKIILKAQNLKLTGFFVTLGLAWVSGMCNPSFSCTINEGNNFESVYVIAHEMGHK